MSREEFGKIKLGDLLRRHRLDANLTQKELGNLLNYSDTIVSRVERAEYLPTPEFIERFVELPQLALAEEKKQDIRQMYEVEKRGPNGEPKRPFHEEWGEAPDASTFYGRYQELNVLTQWINRDSCRLVAVLGMGGIGKTALATKVAKQTSSSFDYVFWRSLRNAPPVEEILTECLQFLSNQQELKPSQDIEKAITRIIHYLAEQRCLLLLDNVEAILREGQAGHYREGYEVYGRFFQRICESQHQSCLLLTSREKPREVGHLAGAELLVRTIRLSGLEPTEGQQVLTAKGLSGSNAAREALVTLYSGNPLALNLVAEMIREVYAGDTDEFLTDDTVIFGGISAVIGEQFARLSTLEQSLMYWLAIERESVSKEVLLDNLVRTATKREFLVALRSLRRRSLIEASDSEFTLQNVVMEYMTNRLVETVVKEIQSGVIELFLSHALTKALAKEYVRKSQSRLILKPVADRLLATMDKQEIAERMMGILTTIRKKQLRQPGYAGGNAINLFRYLEVDLSGYDFSQLSIWQAFLQGINLHQVIFARADLSKSNFTSTFGGIYSTVFSPDGDLFATATANGDIRLWQTTTGKQMLTCEGHTNRVWSVDFSSDGRLLVSGGDDQTVKLWNADTGQCLKTLREQHSHPVRSVAFSPDGRLVASGSDDMMVRLWDVKTGQCLQTLQGHIDRIWCVVFSPNGQFLASSSEDQTVKIWDVRSGQCYGSFQEHAGRIWSVAFSPDGQLLASGSDDQSIKLWDIHSGQCLKTLWGHAHWIGSVAFSPDGQLLASGSDDKTVRLWDVKSGQCFKTLQGHTYRVWTVAFHPDGQMLVSGSEDQTVRLWNVESGQCLKVLQGHVNRVRSIDFSPDGHLLASGGDDQIVKLWDVGGGNSLKTLIKHNYWVRSVAFSPDGRVVASGSGDRTIRLWDVNTGRCLKTLRGHSSRVRSVAFSPDGRLLASGSEDATVKLWEIDTFRCLKTLKDHINCVKSVAFSPDGRLLASGSEDTTVKLWDVATGECLKTLQRHSYWVRSVAFHPNGRLLASGSEDTTVKIWDIDNNKLLKTLEGHASRVWTITFSPDGRLLASGGDDQTVKIWDMDTNQCLRTLHGHTSWVKSVAFSPNGRILASGSMDETIRLWDVQTGECLNILRPDRPYEQMDITDAIGLTKAQKASLKALGAIEKDELGPRGSIAN